MRAEEAFDRCRDNVAVVRERIAEACRRSGRAPADVRLIAVTKYVDAAAARAVVAAGCRDLAESRPQELWAKATALADLAPPVRWHLVGHLQRNKVRRTLEVNPLLHTLDSLRLLETIDAEATRADRTCAALVEVNLAADPGRTGATETDAAGIVRAAVERHPHVRLLGLMGMASVPEGPDAAGQARRQFARLRELRDRLRAENPACGLDELSMGMSGDFVEAILEGATMVRIGSALFAGCE